MGHYWRQRKRKREPSATWADSFARAKEKKKRRPASVGMTVFCMKVRSDDSFVLVDGCCVCSSDALVNDLL
jgi:hypothetical protein